MRPYERLGRRRAGVGALLLVLLVAISSTASARMDGIDPDSEAYPMYANKFPDLFYHNVGLLELMVTNLGVVGSLSSTEWVGAGWRDGEYLWGAALWIGAIAPDNLSYVSTGFGWTAEGEWELRPSVGPIDRIYTTFEGAGGGDRAGFSASQGDDDRDGQVDEDFLNGKDDDGDTKTDEDFEAISQQMFSCEYSDYSDEAIRAYPRHRPLRLKVQQRSFAWSTAGANEFVGLDYVITNEGFETLRDVFIGYFVDSDIGRKSVPEYFTDDAGDYRSVDTTYVYEKAHYTCVDCDGNPRDCWLRDLHIDLAFMYDVPGSQLGGNGGDDMGPGANGYFGGMFLGHTTDPFGERAPSRVQIHTCHFFSGSGTYPLGDPNNDYERYDLLSRGTKPRPASRPADYRYCFSAGPFSELLPGEELKFQVAFVIGAGWDGLLHNAIMAQRVYDGQWRDVDNRRDTGCLGNETCLHVTDPTEPLFWHDPCDSLAPPVGPIKNTTCDNARFWVDNDRNCCTPISRSATACDGWETLVHWVGTVSPPPPKLSTEDPAFRTRLEGDRRVRLEWDNISELSPDPITGEIRFCGYRIWRVEGWRRPIGSVGPSPQDWRLVADLATHPVGSQLNLADYTNAFITPVDTVPGAEGEPLLQYDVGRYYYTDTDGVKNGMLYFYDVTPYSCWYEADGTYVELSSQPVAVEGEGVHPVWGPAVGSKWQDQLIVVPNPWRGGAEWDLVPNDADPTGSHIDFAHLPEKPCAIRIYTLSGELVQTLTHSGEAGRGTVRWNMITRNGQEITSGVYLYATTCGGETAVGRFTVIR